MPLARLPSYLQRVCFVLVAIVAQHQMVSPCASCRLLVHACSPSMLCGRECRSAPKAGTFFSHPRREMMSAWRAAWDCQQSADVWRATVQGGGLSGRSRGLFGPRVDFQCDSWSLNPAGYGRLTPGLSRCTSRGLFFHILLPLARGFESASVLMYKNNFIVAKPLQEFSTLI